MQNLTIAGNCGKDAELRTTQGGDQVLNFSLAVDNGKDKQGNKRDPSWFDCSIWGKRASSLESYITKGTKLVLTGRPTARAYKDKAYLGITVNELTFMGSASDRQRDGHQQSSDGYGSGYGAGGRPGSSDLDDEIPFAPSVL